MTENRLLSRRHLLRGVATSSLLPLLSANLIACSGDDPGRGPEAPGPGDPLPPNFPHGVASGDPLTDRVILWTRITTEEDGDVDVSWEVASDRNFENVTRSGSGSTSADVDYTVKVDVDGLEPGTTYYYRFIYDGASSNIGTTRTLPEGEIDRVRLAVVSCSNYPAGYFHVYREVAKADLDAVVHLGDYIYEYGLGDFATESAEELGREIDPTGEVTTLEGYRSRYAQYRTDRDLSDCHAAHPFIAVWDDHEIANDAYQDGAENHEDGLEGDYQERKMLALQAYFEWMPIRPPASDDEIFRAFAFGDLVDLLMLDTRLFGREKPLSYLDFLTTDGIDVDAAREAIADTSRTMLGAEQKEWLFDRLEGASGRWQVLGQQVLMGRYDVPAAVIALLDPENLDDDAIAEGTAAVLAAAAAARKPADERTAEEQELLDNALPYNLDAWDGYAAERDEILARARELGSKLVVLSGDSHNAWISNLTTAEGEPAGVEFATASITSPGLDGVLGEMGAAVFETIAPDLMPDLVRTNLRKRGYVLMDFGRDQATASFRFVTTVTARDYELDEASAMTFDVNQSLGLDEIA